MTVPVLLSGRVGLAWLALPSRRGNAVRALFTLKAKLNVTRCRLTKVRTSLLTYWASPGHLLFKSSLFQENKLFLVLSLIMN